MNILSGIYYRLANPLDHAVRDIGAIAFRTGVALSRSFGLLPRPKSDGSILVINLTPHFGDGIMLMPMLEAIHEANPNVPLDLACVRGVEDMFRAVPYLRNVYAAPFPSAPPLTLRSAIARRIAILQWYRASLLGLHPRLCLMPRWGDDLFGSHYLAYLIGSPQRVAFSSTVDQYQRTSVQRDRLLTHTVLGGSGLHEPLRFLRVAQQAGLVPVDRQFSTDHVSATLRSIANTIDWPTLHSRLQLPQDRPLAILAPAASSPKRTWPADRWAAVAERMSDAGFLLVLLAGKGDRDFLLQIQAFAKPGSVHVVAGATTLVESIALMRHAALFVGSDSGPGHAAGALGTPTAILFVASPDIYPDHPNGPPRIRPMGPYVQGLFPQILAPCKDACMHHTSHCIETISVADVVDAALALYDRKRHDMENA